MFVVSGFTPKGLLYSVAVGTDVADEPLARGATVGPPHIMALLLMNEGRPLMVTPTGPEVVLNMADPATVLGALYALTKVTDVDGDDVPDVIPALGPDEVG